MIASWRILGASHRHHTSRHILVHAKRASSNVPKEPSSQTANDRSVVPRLGAPKDALQQTSELKNWMLAHHASFTAEEAEDVYRSWLSTASQEAKMQDEARVISNLCVLKRWARIAFCCCRGQPCPNIFVSTVYTAVILLLDCTSLSKGR